MSNNPFKIMGLTQQQIDSNPITKYIYDDSQTLDDLYYLDEAKKNLILPDAPVNTFDPVDDNNLVYGVNNVVSTGGANILVGMDDSMVGESDSNILVGKFSDLSFCDNSIKIGHDGDLLGLSLILRSINNIIVGNDTDNTGSNNIILAHQSGNTVQNDTVQFGPVDNNGGADPITDGSCILCGSAWNGAYPSQLPKVQFLSEHILPLAGQARGDAGGGAGSQYNSGVSFAIPNINGYIRMKYRGQNILLPVLNDPDGDSFPNPAEA